MVIRLDGGRMTALAVRSNDEGNLGQDREICPLRKKRNKGPPPVARTRAAGEGGASPCRGFELGEEEVRVLGLLTRRLLDGQRTYGRLDLARDARDLERERGNELADVLVYTAMAELKRLLTAKKDR